MHPQLLSALADERRRSLTVSSDARRVPSFAAVAGSAAPALAISTLALVPPAPAAPARSPRRLRLRVSSFVVVISATRLARADAAVPAQRASVEPTLVPPALVPPLPSEPLTGARVPAEPVSAR